MQNDLQSLLNEFETPNEAQNPLSTGPLKVKVGDKEYIATSGDEVQKLIDNTLYSANTYVQNLQQEIAAREEELNRYRQYVASQQQENKKSENPKAVDPREFIEAIADDPAKGIQMILEKRPELLEPIIAKHPKVQQLETQTAFQNFAARHPFYANPQVLGGLVKITQHFGLPLNDQGLELAASWAVANGQLPHENTLRMQQQQAFVQQFGINPQQQQNEYVPAPPPQNMAPPRLGAQNGGNNLSTEQKIDQLFNYGNLTTEKMRELLKMQTENRF
jgi:hypothetical protein